MRIRVDKIRTYAQLDTWSRGTKQSQTKPISPDLPLPSTHKTALTSFFKRIYATTPQTQKQSQTNPICPRTAPTRPTKTPPLALHCLLSTISYVARPRRQNPFRLQTEHSFHKKALPEPFKNNCVCSGRFNQYTKPSGSLLPDKVREKLPPFQTTPISRFYSFTRLQTHYFYDPAPDCRLLIETLRIWGYNAEKSVERSNIIHNLEVHTYVAVDF